MRSRDPEKGSRLGDPGAGKAEDLELGVSVLRPSCGRRFRQHASRRFDAYFVFYTEQFGWKKDGEMDLGVMGRYEFLRHGSLIGAIMPKPAETPASAWTFHFRVPDIDAAAERVQSAGGQVVHGTHEVPGGDFVINGVDPQGASFALIGAGS